MEKIKSFYLSFYRNFCERYGTFGLVAAVGAALKVTLFYILIGNISNGFFVALLSCVLIWALFASFRNKWIPAGIYAAISVLMICDVTYESFFNRYLSVNMLGAAEVVDKITASIAEVFQPVSLLLLVDVALIFVCLARAGKTHKIAEAAAPELAKDAEPENRKETTEVDQPEQVKVLAKRKERGRKNRQTWQKWAIEHRIPLLTTIFVTLIIVNLGGNSFVASLSNQEIMIYHLKDIAAKVFGASGEDSLSAFTDSYQEEKEGPLFGVAEGRNLIVIQIESLQNFVIGRSYNGQEITPNLNKLLTENTTYFDHYYQQVGSGNTSDAEFATNNSIYGSLMGYTNKLYGEKNYFRGLPVLLSEKGYETAVFHAYEDKNFWNRKNAYPHLGFKTFYGGLTNREGDGVYNMKEWMGWGLTDTYFFDQTAEFMSELPQPFYSFVITLSNHHPYEMLEHYQYLDLLPEDKDTLVGNYLNSAAYTDHALGEFFDMLKEKGLYSNAVFALYGDHMGLVHSEENDAVMKRLLGKPYDFDTMMNIPLIIHLPDSDYTLPEKISSPGGQLDFLPTMAYLLGFDKLDTLYLGHNLFTHQDGLVAEQTYMTKGSFFKDDMAYEMGRDGVFEHGRAWQISTGKEVPLTECQDDFERAMDIINTSEYILRSDAIRKVFLEGEDATTAFSANISRPYPETIAYAGVPEESGWKENSVEAIDYSYKYGFRNIRVEMTWVGDGIPVGKDPTTGETLMTAEELADWMERHADTNIVVDIEKSGDYFVRYMSDLSPAIADRIILELPELAEYTGKYEAMIDLAGVNQDMGEIEDFLKHNRVWAVTMDAADVTGRYADLAEGDTPIYLREKNDGKITMLE